MRPTAPGRARRRRGGVVRIAARGIARIAAAREIDQRALCRVRHPRVAQHRLGDPGIGLGQQVGAVGQRHRGRR